jgi:hypothetical protein
MSIINTNMKKLNNNQNGFITMILCLLILIIAVLYVSYTHVANAQH